MFQKKLSRLVKGQLPTMPLDPVTAFFNLQCAVLMYLSTPEGQKTAARVGDVVDGILQRIRERHAAEDKK